MDSLFDLPLLLTGPAIIGAHALLALVGLAVTRRHILPRLRLREADSEFAACMIQGVLVFYGLAVALIAVNVWETYSDASKIVSQEATALVSLYRDASAYPEPARGRLQAELRDYVGSVIDQEWPQQRQGKMPLGGIERVNRFQAVLVAFEPATEGQKSLHAETLRAYNQLLLARAARLDALGAGLPAVLWIVIFFGGALCLVSTFFFRVEDARMHAFHVTVLAAFIGVIVLMVFALDRPFRGDLGIRPDALQVIRERAKDVH
jgi:hypothetical protein